MNKDGSENKAANTGKPNAAAMREERLKKALKANLKRRKGQTRLRNQSDNSAQN